MARNSPRGAPVHGFGYQLAVAVKDEGAGNRFDVKHPVNLAVGVEQQRWVMAPLADQSGDR